MGYSQFSSLEQIRSYNYRTVGEVNQALGALKAMYEDGNISEYQYKNVKALLEDTLRDLK